jgi:hypothetical protein
MGRDVSRGRADDSTEGTGFSDSVTIIFAIACIVREELQVVVVCCALHWLADGV